MDSLTETLTSEIGQAQPKEALWAGLGSLEAGRPGKIPALWLAHPTLTSFAASYISH